MGWLACLALALAVAQLGQAALTTCTVQSNGLSALCNGVLYSIATMQPSQRQ